MDWNIGQYQSDLMIILLGLGSAIVSQFAKANFPLIIGACLVIGGSSLVLLRYTGTDPRFYTAVKILVFFIPGLTLLILEFPGGNLLMLTLAAFMLTLGGVLFIGEVTDIEMAKLNPILFLLFAGISLVFGQELAALLLGGFAVLFGYQAFRAKPATD